MKHHNDFRKKVNKCYQRLKREGKVDTNSAGHFEPSNEWLTVEDLAEDLEGAYKKIKMLQATIRLLKRKLKK